MEGYQGTSRGFDPVRATCPREQVLFAPFSLYIRVAQLVTAACEEACYTQKARLEERIAWMGDLLMRSSAAAAAGSALAAANHGQAAALGQLRALGAAWPGAQQMHHVFRPQQRPQLQAPQPGAPPQQQQVSLPSQQTMGVLQQNGALHQQMGLGPHMGLQ